MNRSVRASCRRCLSTRTVIACVLKSRSALESYRAQTGLDSADGRRAIRLGEVNDTRLLQLGVYPGGMVQVNAGALSILGAPLPDSSVAASAAADHLVMRIAPDQYWVL